MVVCLDCKADKICIINECGNEEDGLQWTEKMKGLRNICKIPSIQVYKSRWKGK